MSKFLMSITGILFLCNGAWSSSPLTLTVSCPPTMNIVEGMRTDTGTLGAPKVTSNTGGAVTITYFEAFSRGDCRTKSDVITRFFTVSNADGEQVRCTQSINIAWVNATSVYITPDTFINYVDGIDFTNTILRLTRDPGSLIISYKDSLISGNNCHGDVRMLRRWTIQDKCLPNVTRKANTYVTIYNYAQSFDQNQHFSEAVCEKEGFIELNAKGSFTPYTYRWADSTVTNSRHQLESGIYMVTVTDANKCSSVLTFELQSMSIRADIGGRIQTLNGYRVYPDEIKITDADNVELFCVSRNGGLQYGYILDKIKTGFHEFSFSKNSEALNGVSTKDIVIIQKHILGIKKLEDTLRYIAADVNYNYNITASDISEIRRLILGIKLNFSAVPSWYFLRPDWESVIKPYQTLNSILFKGLSISNFPRQNADVLALKLGDMDLSYRDNNLYSGQSRTSGANDYRIIYGIPKKQSDGRMIMPVKLKSISNYQGIQSKWDIDPAIDNFELISAIDDEEGVFLDQASRSITLSYSTGNDLKVDPDKAMFYFVYSADVTNPSTPLHLNPEFANEIYIGPDLNTFSLTEGTEININSEIQQFRVYPNPASKQIHFLFDPSIKTLKGFPLRIWDVFGHEIYSSNEFLESTIATDSWPEGFYFIQSPWQVEKIVINHQ